MQPTQNSIGAGEFKAKCLQIMDKVKENHSPVIITKRGKPIVKLVPLEEGEFDLFGCMSGTVTIKEDLLAPIDTTWDANK